MYAYIQHFSTLATLPFNLFHLVSGFLCWNLMTDGVVFSLWCGCLEEHSSFWSTWDLRGMFRAPYLKLPLCMSAKGKQIKFYSLFTSRTDSNGKPEYSQSNVTCRLGHRRRGRCLSDVVEVEEYFYKNTFL